MIKKKKKSCSRVIILRDINVFIGWGGKDPCWTRAVLIYIYVVFLTFKIFIFGCVGS